MPRRWVLSSGVLALAGLSSAGFGVARLRGEAEGAVAPPATPSPSPSISPTPDRLAIARARIDAYVRRAGGRLGVAVRDLGGSAAATAGTRRFTTASIVKVDILAALLLREQARGRMLSSSARRRARDMIVFSDNTATTSLFQEIGRAPGLTTANRTFGLRETKPNAHWGLTTTTAADQLRLLSTLVAPDGPLDQAHRGYLLDLMGQVDADQRWGITAAAGPGATAYVKNGWDTASDDGNRWIVNSIGRITEPDHDWLIAVLSDHHRTRADGIRVVEQAATYALRELRAASSGL
ncbi:serine hydrolase [Micromonospora krabiensis]|uniref:Beta-lactamase class A n=1 Tax=Micromonospora krabiensis TaxID=307121 RepID=A0A1C3NA91_9ACTN|nr:serine hydrolase [Micromonospora krabiensis]SBV29453.1 Beta-lactamase class A [Micromonospora krabiensis]